MTRPWLLLIDDDSQFLRLMERTLRNDYEVLTALDALEATCSCVGTGRRLCCWT